MQKGWKGDNECIKGGRKGGNECKKKREGGIHIKGEQLVHSKEKDWGQRLQKSKDGKGVTSARKRGGKGGNECIKGEAKGGNEYRKRRSEGGQRVQETETGKNRSAGYIDYKSRG